MSEDTGREESPTRGKKFGFIALIAAVVLLLTLVVVGLTIGVNSLVSGRCPWVLMVNMLLWIRFRRLVGACFCRHMMSLVWVGIRLRLCLVMVAMSARV